MDIDHIFIFTNDNGKIADELVLFGLTEGSSRVHPGQGTTNRTFSFGNFFFEILWVHNEKEIRSNKVNYTGLWTRANYSINNFSRFGLCIINNDESDNLFEKALKYQPEYLPQGMPFEFLSNEDNPDLPFIFRLPFEERGKKEIKPTTHINGIKRLTGVRFTYINERSKNFLDMFKNESKIYFTKASNIGLTLIFDNYQRGLKKEFKQLDLTIEY